MATEKFWFLRKGEWRVAASITGSRRVVAFVSQPIRQLCWPTFLYTVKNSIRARPPFSANVSTRSRLHDLQSSMSGYIRLNSHLHLFGTRSEECYQQNFVHIHPA